MDITHEKLQQMLQDDFARPVDGYSIYYITRDGDVISTNYLAKNKICYLKKANHKGYLSVSLYSNSCNRRTNLIHRLVASAFLQKRDGLTEVNHKNEVKTDNRSENLEWCNRKYNVNYGSRLRKISNTLSKKVMQIGEDGKTIKIYNSTLETAKDGFIHTHVSACARGERKSHKGYKWKYVVKKSDYDNSKLLRSV